MPPLRIEVLDQNTEQWHEAGVINPGDPYGSISDNTDQGREVYYFGVDMLEGKAVIKKSLGGIDVAIASGRLISNQAGLAIVAELEPGEQHQLNVKTDISSEPKQIRFTHLSE